MDYTITLTDTQVKALEWIAADPKEWITNAITHRALVATKEIQNLYTNFKINKGEAITAVGSTAIIEAAYAEGVIGIAT